MIHLKFVYICILVAVTSQVQCAFIPDGPFKLQAVRDQQQRIAYKESLGPSFPAGTEYKAFNASRYELALSIVDVSTLIATSFEHCQSEAAIRGGHIFEYRTGNRCNIATLQFPLCSSRKGGTVPIYIQQQYLTEGTPGDNTVSENLQLGALSSNIVGNPSGSYRTFRINNPTIIGVAGAYRQAASGSSQFIITDQNSVEKIDANILADPTCYTNSSCGVPFIQPNDAVKQRLEFFHEHCVEEKRIVISRKEEVNVVSHYGIGCEYFSKKDYEVDLCRITFRGSGPLKIHVTLLDFVGNDNCDGFYVAVLAYKNQTESESVRLCATPTNEIDVPAGRGRLDFKGKASKGRKMYGFIIKIKNA